MYSIIEKHYRTHFSQLCKALNYSCGDNAEDVVQEAYARALQYAPAFEMGMPFNRWFSRILSNARKDFVSDKFKNGMHDEFDEYDSGAIDVSQMRMTEKLIKKLHSEIEKETDDMHREILSLNMIYGYAPRDIVKIVDQKLDCVNKILFRFKEKMKLKHSQ